MLNLMILYTTQQKQSLCWSTDQSNHKVGTQQDSGSEMRNIYFVDEFRYLGHVMTADCRDDKDIVKQFTRQNAIGNILVRKFSFASMEENGGIWATSHIVTQIMDVFSGVIHTRNLLKNLQSVIVTYSNDLLMSPDTPARVWHLRWTLLTISRWCSNLLTA